MRLIAVFLAGVVLAASGTAVAQTSDPIADLLARVGVLEANDAEQDARLAKLEQYNIALARYRFREQEMVSCLQDAMMQLRPISRTNRHVVAAPNWTRCYQLWR